MFAVAGCETLDNYLAGMSKSAEADVVAIEDRPLQEPIDKNTFVLTSAEQTVIGEPQIVFAGVEDTFSDLARTYGLGYDDLVAANPEIDPWLPGEGHARTSANTVRFAECPETWRDSEYRDQATVLFSAGRG